MKFFEKKFILFGRRQTADKKGSGQWAVVKGQKAEGRDESRKVKAKSNTPLRGKQLQAASYMP